MDKGFKLDASFLVGEMPVDRDRILVLPFEICADFDASFTFGIDAPIQATTDEQTDFDFRHVPPTAIFRCMVEFETLALLTNVFRRECPVEGGFLVGSEIFHHQHDLVRFRQDFVGKIVTLGNTDHSML